VTAWLVQAAAVGFVLLSFGLGPVIIRLVPGQRTGQWNYRRRAARRQGT
jgi:hypothetical protein